MSEPIRVLVTGAGGLAAIAGKKISKRYDPAKPQGVRGRSSDNTRLRQVLDWEPTISLEDGLALTYHWIENELGKVGRIATKMLVAADQQVAAQPALE